MRWTVLAIALLLAACTRGPEGTESGDCEDGKDNDEDQKVDCEDEGCAVAESCVKAVERARAAERKIEEASARAEAEAKKKAETEAGLPYVDMGGLWIQKGHNGANVSYYAADEYCQGLTLAGKDDWRLPSEQEAVNAARTKKLPFETYAMWTSTKRSKKRGMIVGTTSAAANELALIYDGDCRARCVRGP
jgi:hypothetical protein